MEKQQEINDKEKEQGELATKLKTAKDAFEPLKTKWDKDETERIDDEAKEYK